MLEKTAWEEAGDIDEETTMADWCLLVLDGWVNFFLVLFWCVIDGGQQILN